MQGHLFDAVIKVGGALIEDPAMFSLLVEALDDVPRGRTARPRYLVIPGGGPFADTVRRVDAALAAGDDAAHWMAILGMDQHAHLLVARAAGTELVDSAGAAKRARDAGRLPVLAPYRWLRDRDPLPHSWTVTSDSIAAWIALEVGASELVLVKRAVGRVESVTDSYLSAAIAAGASRGQTLAVRIAGPRLGRSCPAEDADPWSAAGQRPDGTI